MVFNGHGIKLNVKTFALSSKTYLLIQWYMLRMSNHYAFIFKSMNKTVVNFLSMGCITHLEIGVAGRGILGMEAIEK